MVQVISYPTERTARKNHICNNCGGLIKAKEKYLISTCKGDYIYQWKDHIRCAALVDKVGDIFSRDFGEGIDPIWNWDGGMLDVLDEQERIAILELAKAKDKDDEN